MMSNKEYYFETSCLFHEYYYNRDWKVARKLYEELVNSYIIPELIFDAERWQVDLRNSDVHCIVTYFKEDERITNDILDLVLVIMTPYPYFMGYGKL